MIARDVHEPYEELAVGYALSSLEPEDEQAFLRHLPTCARCERSLARHLETLAHLAYAVEPADPPPSLLAGIRREIGTTAQDDPVPVPAEASEDDDAGEAGEADEPTEPVRPIAVPVDQAPPPADASGPGEPAADELAQARARRSARRRVSVVGVAAAAALVVGLGGWNVVLHRDRDRQGRETGQLTQAVAALEKGPARTVPLRTGKGDVSVIAVVQPDWTMSLVVDGLPPNDRASSTYVLWAVNGISPRALATFDVSTSKLDVLSTVPIPADVRHVPDGFAVTRESGRTAPEVPQNPILVQGRTST